MKISELSKKTNLSIDTIRYYEKINLIPVIKNGYYKIYNENILNLLITIKSLKFLGLSIAQIDYLIKLDGESLNDLNEQTVNTVYSILNELLFSINEKEQQLSNSKQMVLKMLNKLTGPKNEVK